GDPLQTLYGWRGADIRFVLEFERDFPEARVVSLDQNFRATGRLVDVANVLGAPLPYGRRLWTDNPPGEPAHLHVAADEQAEAARSPRRGHAHLPRPGARAAGPGALTRRGRARLGRGASRPRRRAPRPQHGAATAAAPGRRPRAERLPHLARGAAGRGGAPGQ